MIRNIEVLCWSSCSGWDQERAQELHQPDYLMEPLLEELRPRPVSQGVQRQRAVWAGQRVAPLQPAALRGRHHPLHQGSESPPTAPPTHHSYPFWRDAFNPRLLPPSTSPGRNAWTSTEKISRPTSPSQAAPARSYTGPNTAASARTSAAASPTSPKPSTSSSSVPTKRGSRGRCCGSRPASATSAAGTLTTSFPSWRITTVTQRSWTNRMLCNDVATWTQRDISNGLFSYWKKYVNMRCTSPEQFLNIYMMSLWGQYLGKQV